MTDSTIKRTQTEPTLVDDYVISQIASFTEVLNLHKLLKSKDYDTPPYYPDELDGYIDFNKSEQAWNFGSYEILKNDYTEGWIAYATQVYGVTPYYTKDEFISGEAVI